MKTSKQQSKAFRRGLHAEKAKEAFIEARRGGDLYAKSMRASVDLQFSLEQDKEYIARTAWDTSVDPDSFLDPEDRYLDLSAHVEGPSVEGWQGLGA